MRRKRLQRGIPGLVRDGLIDQQARRRAQSDRIAGERSPIDISQTRPVVGANQSNSCFFQIGASPSRPRQWPRPRECLRTMLCGDGDNHRILTDLQISTRCHATMQYARTILKFMTHPAESAARRRVRRMLDRITLSAVISYAPPQQRTPQHHHVSRRAINQRAGDQRFIGDAGCQSQLTWDHSRDRCASPSS